MNGSPETLRVFLYALLTALATGLGVLPFFFIKNFSKRVLGFGNALAAGLMLAAAFNLIYEGLAYGMPRTVLGVLLGLLFIVLSRRWLEARDPPGVEQLQGADGVAGAPHRRGDDAALVRGGYRRRGSVRRRREVRDLYLARHRRAQRPRGLGHRARADSQRGHGRAGVWAVVSSLPQPLMAVPAFLFVAGFQPLLPVGLGLAAGAMSWTAFSELLPEALAGVSHSSAAVVIALAAMTVFQVLIA